MATRSTIAVQLADGTVREVYCHWDGYLEHNGQILLRWYNSQALAEQVTSLGDISSLEALYEPTGPHSFAAPQDRVTVLYGRDRGEIHTKPKINRDFSTYANSNAAEDFNYLFVNGRWTYCIGQDRTQWQYLDTAFSEMA